MLDKKRTSRKHLFTVVGILTILLVLSILISISCGSSDYSSGKKSKDDPNVLTKEEYQNKPFNELSEKEKKQAVDKIADDLEKSGTHVEGRNRDRK